MASINPERLKNLSDGITEYRQNNNLSCEAIGKLMDMSGTSVSRLERGAGNFDTNTIMRAEMFVYRGIRKSRLVPPELAKKYAKMISDYRQSHGLTLNAMARMVKVSRTTIYRLEKFDRQIKLEFIPRILKIIMPDGEFGINLDYHEKEKKTKTGGTIMENSNVAVATNPEPTAIQRRQMAGRVIPTMEMKNRYYDLTLRLKMLCQEQTIGIENAAMCIGISKCEMKLLDATVADRSLINHYFTRVTFLMLDRIEYCLDHDLKTGFWCPACFVDKELMQVLVKEFMKANKLKYIDMEALTNVEATTISCLVKNKRRTLRLVIIRLWCFMEEYQGNIPFEKILQNARMIQASKPKETKIKEKFILPDNKKKRSETSRVSVKTAASLPFPSPSPLPTPTPAPPPPPQDKPIKTPPPPSVPVLAQPTSKISPSEFCVDHIIIRLRDAHKVAEGASREVCRKRIECLQEIRKEWFGETLP